MVLGRSKERPKFFLVLHVVDAYDNNVQFYTYLYLRRDGSVRYVGKGSGRRAFQKTVGHTPPKDRSRILIQYHPDEQAAFEAEVFLIAYYGRRDIGSGPLQNVTDGGEGAANPSERIREVCRANGRKNGKRQGAKNAKNGHFQRICTPEVRAAGGKISGKRNVDNGHLDRIRSTENWLTGAKINAGKLGRRNVESGHLARIRTPEVLVMGGKAACHKRWHLARGMVKTDCPLCVPATL